MSKKQRTILIKRPSDLFLMEAPDGEIIEVRPAFDEYFRDGKQIPHPPDWRLSSKHRIKPGKKLVRVWGDDAKEVLWLEKWPRQACYLAMRTGHYDAVCTMLGRAKALAKKQGFHIEYPIIQMANKGGRPGLDRQEMSYTPIVALINFGPRGKDEEFVKEAMEMIKKPARYTDRKRGRYVDVGGGQYLLMRFIKKYGTKITK